MSSPFPGMNPYLENPELWSEFHNRLILAIANSVEPQLSPQYRVAIEKRTYLIGLWTNDRMEARGVLISPEAHLQDHIVNLGR